MLAEYEDETLGRIRSVGLPLHVSGFSPDYRPGPDMGGDTDAILAELGYTHEAVERLRSAGAFGGDPAGPGGDPVAV